MTDTADTLLRELVEILGDRPYQAKGPVGPFECMFCGLDTVDERQPIHDATCPWPRILVWRQKLEQLN